MAIKYYENKNTFDIEIPSTSGFTLTIAPTEFVIDKTGEYYNNFSSLTEVTEGEVVLSKVAYSYDPVRYAVIDNETGKLEPGVELDEGGGGGPLDLSAYTGEVYLVDPTNDAVSIKMADSVIDLAVGIDSTLSIDTSAISVSCPILQVDSPSISIGGGGSSAVASLGVDNNGNASEPYAEVTASINEAASSITLWAGNNDSQSTILLTSSGNVGLKGNLLVTDNSDQLHTPPASASATGGVGEVRICSDAIYVCIATDTWVKTALATWA